MRSRRHPDDRQHFYPGAPAGCNGKKGGRDHCLGRSRGGLTTKIHALVDRQGLPVRLGLTAGSVITGLNIAYEEKETRSFIKVNLLALAITAGAVALVILAMIAVAALGHLERIFPNLPGALVTAGKLGSYILLFLGAALGAAALYRYGPNRKDAKWAWITPGSAFASVGWIVLTVGFGFYAAHFGNYGKTYGSLATVVVLLTWIYLSAYVFLVGAELNSETERQTAEDTTDR